MKIRKLLALPLIPIYRNVGFFVFMYILGAVCALSTLPDTRGATLYENLWLELFVDDYAACLVLSLLPRRLRGIGRAVAYTVLYATALADVYCFGKFGSTLNPSMLMLVGETDSREAGEFLRSYLTPEVLRGPVGNVVCVLALHVAWSLRRRIFRKLSYRRRMLALGRIQRLRARMAAVEPVAGIIVAAVVVWAAVASAGNKAGCHRLMSASSVGEVEHLLTAKDHGVMYMPIYRLAFSIRSNQLAARQIEQLIGASTKARVDSCSYTSPHIVLIIGESGVGKEIIPRVIHDNSPRRREKYFAINCGSIPEGTIDSELFGHEKGSFTGAIGESEGYFGIANKGTIFLDEVGELPIQTQARLLRVLETGEYIRVGGTEIMKTDVRIVAATNVNMRKAVSEGRFREDLYYRLNTIPIQMPALRERGDDILLLFRLFAMQMAEKYRLPKISLSDEAKQIMLKYKWPGNVRQLKNITEQMSVLSREREIDAQTLTQFIPRDEESTQLATIQKDGKDDHSYASERELLYKILYELKGNVSDLRREMNSLRKQLDEARQLGGTGGYVSPVQPNTQVAPVSSVSPVPAVSSVPSVSPVSSVPPITDLDELQHIRQEIATRGIRGTYKPEAEDAEIEEIKEENENLNLSDLSKQMIEKALERNNGNRKKAAEELGISDRTLYRKINKYKL